MLGPIFVREATVLPKRTKSYLGRAIYVLVLLMLLCTGYMVLDGSRTLGNAGDAARFGGWMFGILAPLQWLILSALASVGAASSVAQEKDRRTLLLLLMTRLSGSELVVGKMLATLLSPLSLLLCGVPVMMALPILGGVSPGQVMATTLVTAAMVILSGAVGTMMGLWREKTFQAIALTVMALLMYVGVGQWLHSRDFLPEIVRIAVAPLEALTLAASPLSALSTTTAAGLTAFVIWQLMLSAAVAVFSIRKVRRWNPSREVRFQSVAESTTEFEAEKGSTAASPASWKVRAPRKVWDNPILWREIRTWAYGKKIVVIRVAYAILLAAIVAILWQQMNDGSAFEPAARIGRALPAVTLPVAALGVVTLVLVNALAVGSITGERDGLALDLLLVTDLSPREFIFGKMVGTFYVTKEIMIPPLLLFLYLAARDVVTWENAIYLILGTLTLYVFVTMLGIHCGLNFPSSRTATLASLGTVFFLCVGIAVCMTIMVSFRGAFQYQLPPFLVMILGGAAALFATLGWRNPSAAVGWASFTLPVVTFFAITQFLLQTDHLNVIGPVAVGYGFAVVALIIPALSEFDVSLGRERRAGDSG